MRVGGRVGSKRGQKNLGHFVFVWSGGLDDKGPKNKAQHEMKPLKLRVVKPIPESHRKVNKEVIDSLSESLSRFWVYAPYFGSWVRRNFKKAE